MNFEFAAATRILFGPGEVKKIGALAVEMGRRVLLVTGVDGKCTAALEALLAAVGLESIVCTVEGEPTVAVVQAWVVQALEANVDLVIGLGGGSALDTGKAVAALSANPGEVIDYLEVVGKGQPLKKPSLSYIAIPTTAGTGSEVTRNAVLGVPERRVKVSLRSPMMLPRLALVDPELTYSLPPAVTASTGLDALTQVIEPFVSNRANPLTDAVCREGIQRAAGALRRVYQNGEDAAARQDMCLTSLFGGLALANARLGAVHGFAGPLGGMFPAPHGVICARLLPFVMQANVRALVERAPQHPALGRYAEVAQWLTGDPQAQAMDGVNWVQTLCQDLKIPSLSQYGLKIDDLPELIENSARASSMQGNPVQLTEKEMRKILEQAL